VIGGERRGPEKKRTSKLCPIGFSPGGGGGKGEKSHGGKESARVAELFRRFEGGLRGKIENQSEPNTGEPSRADLGCFVTEEKGQPRKK